MTTAATWTGGLGDLIADCGPADWPTVRPRLLIRLNHEQQHQELPLTAINRNLAHNLLCPAYRADLPADLCSPLGPVDFVSFDGGLVEIGARPEGFAWDNERPGHRVFLAPFELADRPVTNGDVLAFMEDGS